MEFNVNFRTVEDNKDRKKLIDSIYLQSLGYPKYNDWVMRTEFEMEIGYKKAIIAESDGKILANVIYQPHKEMEKVREIKNMRVDPSVRFRYFASFTMKNVESINPQEFDALMCDIKSDRRDVFDFLLRMGYFSIGNKPLYDDHSLDTIMIKTKNKRTKSGIVYRATELIS